jgi:hypothetical protein
MIRASITAYSTAVGPSSFFRNDTSFFAMLRISNSRRVIRDCHEPTFAAVAPDAESPGAVTTST